MVIIKLFDVCSDIEKNIITYIYEPLLTKSWFRISTYDWVNTIKFKTVNYQKNFIIDGLQVWTSEPTIQIDICTMQCKC
jgi:hypothetical protein